MKNKRDYSEHPLNVGIVGLGNVGERHARTYLNEKRCRVRWLYDIDHDLAERLAPEFDGARIAKDYRTLIDDDNLDVISVCSFDGDHFEQIIPALEKGVHLFVEKPICRSTEEIRAIKEAWSRGGRPAFDSNLMSRGSPLYQWLATFIARGGLGDIYAIDAEYWYGRLHKLTHGWRRHVENYSVMQGGAVHLMDVIFMMINERPTSCTAFGNRICTEGSEFRYNDFVTATYRFPSSLIARVTANFGCVHRHQHVLRVFGTRATFLLDDAGPRVHATRDDITSGRPAGSNPALPIDLPYRPATKGDLIPPLIDLIVSGADSEPLAQRNFDVISAIIAADESVAAGNEVPVTYV